jgi:suppressor of ftsI
MNSITRRGLLRAGAALATTATAVKAAKKETKKDVLLLECKFIEKVIDGVRCKLRCYNGKITGETIKVRGGETLRVRVKNSLPPVDSNGWNGSHNVPHMFDSTNLHLHGLDVIPHLFEPLGTGNPLSKMIDVMPGRSYDYEFKIPADQPPGLSWYHPHHHGRSYHYLWRYR